MTNEEEFELDKLRAELAKERHMKHTIVKYRWPDSEMMEQSLAELRTTVEDLEKRMEGLDEDSCEWKTRYETQIEMNQQLHMQALVLSEKIDEAKRTLKDGKLPKTMRMFDDSAEVTPHFVKTLERSKQIFENQLRDLEWRLDQESKAYHKANEERKNYVMEINSTKGAFGAFETVRVRQKAGLDLGDLSTSDTPRIANSNIAQDHRILDAKKGPIRKTAAVKNLPRLD